MKGPSLQKLVHILTFRCPRCGAAPLYKVSNPYKLRTLGDMHSNCQHCGQPFSLEPGFYFGATYVSYALTVVFLATGLLTNWLLIKQPFELVLPVLLTLFVLISPFIFRLSRAIWLGFFVKYDPKRAQEPPAGES